MGGIIDKERQRVEEVEYLTPENTIGLCQIDSELPSECVAKFDVRRLRRLLLAYEDEFRGESAAYLGVKERTDMDGYVLVLQPESSSTTCVGLASLVSDNRGDDR